NPAAVVDHRARAVRIETDDDLLGIAGERLVDGVVDDLVDHVVQARAVVGIADVHARTLAHGIEALEDLDRLCVVVGREDLAAGGFGHADLRIVFCGRKYELGLTRKYGLVQAKVVAPKLLAYKDFFTNFQTREWPDSCV